MTNRKEWTLRRYGSQWAIEFSDEFNPAIIANPWHRQFVFMTFNTRKAAVAHAKSHGAHLVE